MPSKTCSKCGEEKPLSEFNKHKRMKDGYASECKACRKAYREAHKEKIAEFNRTYWKENRERMRAYYLENREQLLEYARAYYQANPEIYRARDHRRRARQLNAEGTITRDQVKALFEEFPVCYCGAPATEIEHIIPLSRDGTNLPDNLVTLCASCNSSKSAKLPLEYLSTLPLEKAICYVCHTTRTGYAFGQKPRKKNGIRRLVSIHITPQKLTSTPQELQEPPEWGKGPHRALENNRKDSTA